MQGHANIQPAAVRFIQWYMFEHRGHVIAGGRCVLWANIRPGRTPQVFGLAVQQRIIVQDFNLGHWRERIADFVTGVLIAGHRDDSRHERVVGVFQVIEAGEPEHPAGVISRLIVTEFAQVDLDGLVLSCGKVVVLPEQPEVVKFAGG